ncbi:MAG TPA: PIN domain-containing protein [Actinomycetota bacterium]|nr:PIN domain-containing protein [Actinomycetota bacterium]
MRFADSSFWIGLQVPRDSRHEDASALWRDGPGALITSDLVMGETWTFLRRRATHADAVGFYDAVGKSDLVTVRHIDEDLAAEAWKWLRRRDERPYSFVDATSFALMRRLRLREALAYDGDFASAGFVEVRSAH